MNLGLVRRFDAKRKEFDYQPIVNDRRVSHSWVIGKTGVGNPHRLVFCMALGAHDGVVGFAGKPER